MHTLRKIFDWIFPPSKEAECVNALSKCIVESFFSYRTVREACVLSSYNNPKMRALIHEAKFYNNKKAQELLHILISLYIKHHSSNIDMIVPVPLSSKRFRERGHNQVISILKARPLQDIHIEVNILKRNRNTQPQTELPRKKRIQNMSNAFSAVYLEKIKDKNILLIDDVITTGATLSAAKAALLPHSPASVTCLALTH